eukprot:gb/GFBE01003816.1/.p1 GENE.gb/GFBE01003816.1/~~gb/GFBE01003816.1/.p1  ORF type:complete len:260 (+),score=53.78 gb/GFBE01003816.1/:1-780(+)
MTEAPSEARMERRNSGDFTTATNNQVEEPWWMKVDNKPVYDLEDIQDHFHFNKHQKALTMCAKSVLERPQKDPEAINRLDPWHKDSLQFWQQHVDQFIRHREHVAERYSRKEELGQLRARNKPTAVDEEESEDSEAEAADETPRGSEQPSSPRSPHRRKTPGGVWGQALKATLANNKGSKLKAAGHQVMAALVKQKSVDSGEAPASSPASPSSPKKTKSSGELISSRRGSVPASIKKQTVILENPPMRSPAASKDQPPE